MIITTRKCPYCGEDCKFVVNEHEEEHMKCFACGYQWHFEHRRDENGEFVLMDPERGHVKSNYYARTTEYSKPFGVFILTDLLVTVNSEEEFDHELSLLIDLVDTFGAEDITFNRFHNGKHYSRTVTISEGTKPGDVRELFLLSEEEKA